MLDSWMQRGLGQGGSCLSSLAWDTPSSWQESFFKEMALWLFQRANNRCSHCPQDCQIPKQSLTTDRKRAGQENELALEQNIPMNRVNSLQGSGRHWLEQRQGVARRAQTPTCVHWVTWPHSLSWNMLGESCMGKIPTWRKRREAVSFLHIPGRGGVGIRITPSHSFIQCTGLRNFSVLWGPKPAHINPTHSWLPGLSPWECIEVEVAASIWRSGEEGPQGGGTVGAWQGMWRWKAASWDNEQSWWSCWSPTRGSQRAANEARKVGGASLWRTLKSSLGVWIILKAKEKF